MKKLFMLAAIASLAACNTKDEAKTDSMKSDSTKKDNIAYPYTASYSSQFEVGSSANALTLLNMYRSWDDNALDNMKGSFADSATLMLADGTVISGSRDSVLAISKRGRSMMGNVQDKVEAWLPLKSTDRNEDWVAIWTNEVLTSANGKKDSSYLHEIWRFNKDGKVDFMRQFVETAPKK